MFSTKNRLINNLNSFNKNSDALKILNKIVGGSNVKHLCINVYMGKMVKVFQILLLKRRVILVLLKSKYIQNKFSK